MGEDMAVAAFKRQIIPPPATIDVFVIGGGIVGLAIAEDAARRGLSVLLCERGDFAAATSAGCFRLVHGGVRYLQHLDFSRMFASVREQTILRKRASHLIRPLPFLLPVYGSGKEGRLFLEAGMTVYEMLTCGRNRGAPKEQRLPRHSFVGRDEMLARFPGLKRRDLKGAVRFWDCQMRHPDRLSLAVARTAAAAGAVLWNYAEVDLVERVHNADEYRISVRDVLESNRVSVAARAVVNATGPWARELMEKWFGESSSSTSTLVQSTVSRGFQVALPPVAHDEALALSSEEEDATSVLKRGKRSYFLQPWHGLTLAGTTDEEWCGTPEEYSVTREDVREFLRSLAGAFESNVFHESKVLQTFGGLLPAERIVRADSADASDGTAGRIRILRDDIVEDHGSSNPSLRGVLTVVGVKYTTFRALAEDAVDRIERQLRGAASPSCTSREPLFGGSKTGEELKAAARNAWSRCLSETPCEDGMLDDLVTLYGSDATDVLERAGDAGRDGKAVFDAQVDHALEEEMAMRLPDIVFRRTFLGTGAMPDERLLRDVAKRCQQFHGWSDSRVEEEIAAVENDEE